MESTSIPIHAEHSGARESSKGIQLV